VASPQPLARGGVGVENPREMRVGVSRLRSAHVLNPSRPFNDTHPDAHFFAPLGFPGPTPSGRLRSVRSGLPIAHGERERDRQQLRHFTSFIGHPERALLRDCAPHRTDRN